MVKVETCFEAVLCCAKVFSVAAKRIINKINRSIITAFCVLDKKQYFS
jgi:hypothetical protein